MAANGLVKIGPVGNPNVQGANNWDEGGRSEIAQIFIWHGERIYALQFQYVENGASVLSEVYGAPSSATKFTPVKFDYSSEYITSISGHKDQCSGISSLTFGTNQRTYGPFGLPGGRDDEFRFELGQDSQFGGFCGATNSVGLSAIGVYLKPTITQGTLNSNKFMSKPFGSPYTGANNPVIH